MPPMPACAVFDFVYFTPMCDDPRHKLKQDVPPKTLLVAWSLVRIDCPRAVSRSPLIVDVLLAQWEKRGGGVCSLAPSV